VTRFRRITAALVAAALLSAVALMVSRRGSQPAAATTPAAPSVSIVTPQRERWPVIVRADGAIAAWQEAIIGAEVGSLRITALHADVGSIVKRGDLLAQLDDDAAKADVQKQEAAVTQARAALRLAEQDLNRSRVVADSGSLSTQQRDQYESTETSDRAALASAEAQLQSARIALRQTRVIAVDDGIVSSRSALLGNVVAAGTELFRLVRQSRIEWQGEVDAQQLARIRVGQHARVTLPSGERVEGLVRLTAPTLSASTGRAIVYVSLPASSGARAGMYASGTIELADTAALTLPESALVPRDGREDVYVLNDDDNKVARRTVTTGRRRDSRVEVISGLEATARVVASGGAFLSDGAAVAVAADTAHATAAESQSSPAHVSPQERRP
jgi:RND family efflux transporter MFP subunit